MQLDMLSRILRALRAWMHSLLRPDGERTSPAQRDLPEATGPKEASANPRASNSRQPNDGAGNEEDGDHAGAKDPIDVVEPGVVNRAAVSQGSTARPEAAADAEDPPRTEGDGNESGPVPPPLSIPGKRTARRNPTARRNDKVEARQAPKFTPRPELLCRKRHGSSQWEVTLSVDEERRVEAARLNGQPLESVNGEWPLPWLAGRLSIAYKKGDPIEISLSDREPLIFKLKKDWSGDGRRVLRMTKGYFIVVAPKEWTRVGNVRVEPEECPDSGFMAHFFSPQGSDSVEESGGFLEYDIALSGSGFELAGKRIFDDSREGDLFVGDPPRLDPSPSVVWARVGEEEQDGWSGENFQPAEKTLAEVLAGRQGRFFVRVYDRNQRLLDSDQFRYLLGLREIVVNEAPYTPRTLLVPPPSGHPPTTVRFIGAGFNPLLPSETAHVKAKNGGLVVSPHPDTDDLSFALEADDQNVDIVLHLPRIWWRLEQDGDEAADGWRDTAPVLTRQEFRERTVADALVRLRLPERIKSLSAGFGDQVDRRYSRVGSDVELPLAHFLDYAQIDQMLAKDASFNVRFDQSKDRSGEETLGLVRIPADPAPTIVSFRCEPETVDPGDHATLCWTTRNTDGVSAAVEPFNAAVEPNGSLEIMPLETTTFALRLSGPSMQDVTKRIIVRVSAPPDSIDEPIAHVRRAVGGWRRGKGFSRGELGAAGLPAAEATDRSIRVDHRRQSAHPTNIDALRRLTDG